MSWGDNYVKNWSNVPKYNPKPDLHNIKAHIKFVKIHWDLLKLLSWNENTDVWWPDDEIYLLAIPNQISITSMHKPDLYNINAQTKFGENPLIFTQVIVQKRKIRRIVGR